MLRRGDLVRVVGVEQTLRFQLRRHDFHPAGILHNSSMPPHSVSLSPSELDDEMSTASTSNGTTESEVPQPRRSAILRGFSQAITAVTVCSTGGSGLSDEAHDAMWCIAPTAADVAKAADQKAHKVKSMVAQKMTVSKAILADVEVISMLIERLFA